MSQYANFYIKTRKEEWVQLNSYSRSSAIFQQVRDYLSYEEGVQLSSNFFKTVISNIEKSINELDRNIRCTDDKKSLIATMNNTVEDKLAAIQEIESSIEEYEEYKDELVSALGILRTLYDITDYNTIYAGIEWNPRYSEEE